MSRLRILYLGTISGTCLDRANAYRRLGHQVTHLDPRKLLPSTGWTDRITWRVGGGFWSGHLLRRLKPVLAGQRFDLCHVDCGEWVSADVIALLRQHAGTVINYCIDDPTGPRDGRRFLAYRKALPFYDLVIVMREINAAEVAQLGARRVLRVFMSADEVSHAPLQTSSQQLETWRSDVLFLGTWMPERGPFLAELIKRGIPLTIRGAHWQKAPQWPVLKPCWKGGAVHGDDYAHAIQGARISLGLLSQGNRDRHTTRSFEVPSLGSLLCAERTDEHQRLYLEGYEAVFWSNARECAELCLGLLSDEPRRQAMAQRGQDRFRSSGYSNERVLSHLLEAALT